MKKMTDEDLKTVAGGTGPDLLGLHVLHDIVDTVTQPLPTLDQMREMLKNKQKPA